MCVRCATHPRHEAIRTWEHAGLEEAQKEASGNKSAISLNQALTDGNQSKSEHADGEPDMWLESLEDDIARNLENNIGDEEDGQTRAVLSAAQTEVLLKAKDSSICDICPVEKGQKIHNRQNRDQS